MSNAAHSEDDPEDDSRYSEILATGFREAGRAGSVVAVSAIKGGDPLQALAGYGVSQIVGRTTNAVFDRIADAFLEARDSVRDVQFELVVTVDPPEGRAIEGLLHGDIEFQVNDLSITESLNEAYCAKIVATLDDAHLNLSILLETNARLTIVREGVGRQLFGVVTQAREVLRGDGRCQAELTLEPAFALLAKKTNTRIFQYKSADEILRMVLEQGLAPYGRSFEIPPMDLPVREYCVQFDESDLHFCCRLMEEEGLTFHFDSSEITGLEIRDKQETQNQAHRPGEVLRIYRPAGPETGTPVVLASNRAHEEAVTSLRFATELAPTKLTKRDYDWSAPHRFLEDQWPKDEDADSRREDYDPFPTRIGVIGEEEQARATELSGTPREALAFDGLETLVATESNRPKKLTQMFEGTGTVCWFTPGSVFALEQDGEPLGTYRLLEVTHEDVEGSDGYQNRFRCIPADIPYLPELAHFKPRADGIYTAVVCGPIENQPHTDRHGRVKLHFHWDREKEPTEENTCWVRTMQAAAGPRWGHQFIPYVGMEVLVGFLNSDPDRPIVLGTAYNGSNLLPFHTESEDGPGALRSGFKTVTGNELSFSDLGGEEEIFIHAVRNLNENVENDHATTVHANQSNTVEGNHNETITGDQSLVVKSNRTQTVDKDETVTIKGNRTKHIDLDETIEVVGARTQTVEGKETVTFNGHREMTIQGEDQIHVEGNKTDHITNEYNIAADTQFSVTQGNTSYTMAGEQAVLNAANDIRLINGGGAVDIQNANGEVHVCAESKIVLGCGGSMIVLNADGSIELVANQGIDLQVGANSVTLSATEVTINGTRVITTAADECSIQAAMIKLN